MRSFISFSVFALLAAYSPLAHALAAPKPQSPPMSTECGPVLSLPFKPCTGPLKPSPSGLKCCTEGYICSSTAAGTCRAVTGGPCAATIQCGVLGDQCIGGICTEVCGNVGQFCCRADNSCNAGNTCNGVICVKDTP